VRWSPFRPDEAKKIAVRLAELRPCLVALRWETRAAPLETVVVLAAWRSRPMEDWVAVLIDVIDVARDAGALRLGRWAHEREETRSDVRASG
jgi:hypothetical protein